MDCVSRVRVTRTCARACWSLATGISTKRDKVGADARYTTDSTAVHSARVRHIPSEPPRADHSPLTRAQSQASRTAVAPQSRTQTSPRFLTPCTHLKPANKPSTRRLEPSANRCGSRTSHPLPSYHTSRARTRVEPRAHPTPFPGPCTLAKPWRKKQQPDTCSDRRPLPTVPRRNRRPI